MSGVPLNVNRGVPSFHDGIETCRKGPLLGSKSSAVCDLVSFKGFDIMTLKTPVSFASPGVASCTVESDTARRCRVAGGLESKYAFRDIPFGDGEFVIGVGVN
jgi:hypothetical protein